MATMGEFMRKKVAGRIGILSKAPEPVLVSLEKATYPLFVKDTDPEFAKRELEDKFYISTALLRLVLKAYRQGSPQVRKTLRYFVDCFLGAGPVDFSLSKSEYAQNYGEDPPTFLVIAPTGKCNLQCKGCYAASSPFINNSLTFYELDWILTHKYKEWNSWFTVITGGEPFIWRSDGYDLIDIAVKHPEQIFMVYTNGTLFNRELAKRIAEAGNIYPAISIEGVEKETDERRGKGTYAKIMQSMENLRETGAPFGISTTAMPHNAELLISDEFIDFYFNKQGALFQWIFQYMPIGRGPSVLMQVPPGVRKKMWEREMMLVREKHLFIADFWNSGVFSSGCIAGGRSGGYFYIDWNGNITPCAFVPFYTHNIKDFIYNGKTLSDVLQTPLLTAVRKWQKSYNYKKPVNERGNEIRPCFIRDHFKKSHRIITELNAKSLDENAKYVLKDPEYYKLMLQYDVDCARLLDPIWENLYRRYQNTNIAKAETINASTIPAPTK
ncbi:radical SAM protein [bacterium]|nr:MAG: radical SAM protein [bacterium]